MNDCINIENNIKDIYIIKEKIQKCNLNNSKVKFTSEESEIKKLLEEIKVFGNLYLSQNFKFIKCPENISIEKKYLVEGDKENKITKIGFNDFGLFIDPKMNYAGIICQNKIESKNIECRWKIKILKSNDYNIFVGIAPIDFDINSSSTNDGWFFHCNSSKLFSGPPQKYNGKKTNIKKPKDEIIIIFNSVNGSLNFIVDNE